jgi:hypothetical protein
MVLPTFFLLSEVGEFVPEPRLSTSGAGGADSLEVPR